MTRRDGKRWEEWEEWAKEIAELITQSALFVRYDQWFYLTQQLIITGSVTSAVIALFTVHIPYMYLMLMLNSDVYLCDHSNSVRLHFHFLASLRFSLNFSPQQSNRVIHAFSFWGSAGLVKFPTRFAFCHVYFSVTIAQNSLL